MACSPPGYSVHGILQARILEWVAIPFSGGSSQPSHWTWVSGTAGRSFYRPSHQGSLGWPRVHESLCTSPVSTPHVFSPSRNVCLTCNHNSGSDLSSCQYLHFHWRFFWVWLSSTPKSSESLLATAAMACSILAEFPYQANWEEGNRSKNVKISSILTWYSAAFKV